MIVAAPSTPANGSSGPVAGWNGFGTSWVAGLIVPLLAMYIKHREQRESAILASYQRGNKLPEEIVLDVYADVPAAMHVFAVRNVELHLRKLRQEARL